MPGSDLLDVTGRRRSPAATPGFLSSRVPPNTGRQYPPDPPRPEEILLVMRQAGEGRHGLRIRALIAGLWRGGLRISEALALTETDIDKRTGALLIRHGKGDRRREVGMDEWGFEHLDAWLEHRVQMQVGTLFCVIDGPIAGVRGQPPQPAPNYADWPLTRGCGDGSRRISSATGTRSSWPASGSR
jgi:integrase